MKKQSDLLLPYYFGSISESDRLEVEQALLVDTEYLLNYLDLKRQLELAPLTHQAPSSRVYLNLRDQVRSKKKFFIPFALTASVGAALIFGWTFVRHPSSTQPSHNQSSEIYFDTPGELSVSSSVL